ncbi:hypothetical protein SO802_019993 [Lithocarpus litseifolius]|uniref:Maturase K n=1 Tax=Lithocarpus litseifolius TaxID=425828 RepID=A0AAW2CB67_9ROSI
MIQTYSKENPMVNINWSMLFEVLNKSKAESAHLLWECPLSREMFGPFVEGSFRNVIIMLKIFSCSFDVYWINFHSRSYKDGHRLFGQFGMLEINFILSISKPIQRLFLMEQSVFCRSIRGW